MKEFEFILKDKNGLHARPAGQLSATAKTFESDIEVRVGERIADGKRLLSLMSLGAKFGDTLVFQISGRDEDAAEQAIREHCQSKLSEE